LNSTLGGKLLKSVTGDLEESFPLFQFPQKQQHTFRACVWHQTIQRSPYATAFATIQLVTLCCPLIDYVILSKQKYEGQNETE
jgi:hypothetical protein